MKGQKLQSLRLEEVEIQDAFWSQYIHLIHDKVIPYQWEIINDRVEGAAKSYGINNFLIAAGLKEGEFGGMVFQDTDVAKWLEAVAYSIQTKPNPELEKWADWTIDIIEKAQCEDGYINTYYTLVEPAKRWTNLMEGHELYTAGHLMEAAVAYYNSTGKDKFLKVMCRFADYICTIFGNEEGQLKAYPGHQEIELALVRLYEVTKNKNYLNMAKFFIDERGKQPNYFDKETERSDHKYIFPEFKFFDRKYSQSHLPVKDQESAEGHAVRAVYMYIAMADLAYEYQDEELLKTCRKLYDNIVQKRMYLTGSIGSAEFGERFTCDYDLPNHSNYSETCASIGLALFSLRMLKIEKDAKYADTFERALYNTVLAGISREGTSFFYVNPLEVVPEICENNTNLRHVKAERQKWFGVACCPPNIARTLASLSQYIYCTSEEELYVNLYISNKTNFRLGERNITAALSTCYPIQSNVKLHVTNDTDSSFTLALRIPGSCQVKNIKIDGETIDYKKKVQKGYIKLLGLWRDSEIEIEFDMPARLICANPRVSSDIGKAAIVKGPLVYCLEEVDNGKNLAALSINENVELIEKFEEDILDGILVIEAEANKIDESDWESELYKPVNISKKPCHIRAVPYYLWNNRGKGEMLVWIRLN